MMTLYSYF